MRVQVEIVETIAAAGRGQPDGRGRRRPVDLPVPGRQLRQHPQVPGAASRLADLSCSTSITGPRPRSSPSRRRRSGTTNRAFPRSWSRRGRRACCPWSSPRPTSTRRPTWSASRSSRRATRRFRWARWRCSIATTTTASCSRASWWRGAFPTRSAADCGSSSRPISRTCWRTCGWCVNPRDEASWRRMLLLLPGIGPAKAAAVYQHLAGAADPLAALASAETMAAVPPKSKGFFAAFVSDLRQLTATDPEHHPAAAIEAILKGGYPATVRQKYDRPENRIADLEQFAVLAAKYDSLERLLAELLLAGDVYGMDTRGRRRARGRAGPEHGPPGQGPGVVSRLRDPPDRGQLSPPPGARRARRRGGGAADLLRGGQPGDERADPDLSLDHHPRRLRPHGLHHAQPVPHGDRRGAVTSGPSWSIEFGPLDDEDDDDELRRWTGAGRGRASRGGEGRSWPRGGSPMAAVDRQDPLARSAWRVLACLWRRHGLAGREAAARPGRRVRSGSRSSTRRPAGACRWSSSGRSTRSATSPTATASSRSTSPGCWGRRSSSTSRATATSSPRTASAIAAWRSRRSRADRRGSRSSG